MSINIQEIFKSIQGETCWSGFPSIFIRLAGCNLDCSYCDTPVSKNSGTRQDIDSIITETRSLGAVHHVTVTGGEPMHQDDTPVLMRKLLYENFRVQLETNGSVLLSSVPGRVRKIVDVKTPSSGESGSFLNDNIEFLDENDEIKFLVCNKNDYDFSKSFIKDHLEGIDTAINFSPVYKKMEYRKLAEWILEDGLNVRLNLQIHKIIGLR